MRCTSAARPLGADDDKVLEGRRCQRWKEPVPESPHGGEPPTHPSTKGHLCLPCLGCGGVATVSLLPSPHPQKSTCGPTFVEKGWPQVAWTQVQGNQGLRPAEELCCHGDFRAPSC